MEAVAKSSGKSIFQSFRDCSSKKPNSRRSEQNPHEGPGRGFRRVFENFAAGQYTVSIAQLPTRLKHEHEGRKINVTTNNNHRSRKLQHVNMQIFANSLAYQKKLPFRGSLKCSLSSLALDAWSSPGEPTITATRCHEMPRDATRCHEMPRDATSHFKTLKRIDRYRQISTESTEIPLLSWSCERLLKLVSLGKL